MRGTRFHDAANPILPGIAALPAGAEEASDSYHLDVLRPHVSAGPEADINLKVSTPSFIFASVGLAVRLVARSFPGVC